MNSLGIGFRKEVSGLGQSENKKTDRPRVNNHYLENDAISQASCKYWSTVHFVSKVEGRSGEGTSGEAANARNCFPRQ